MFKFNFYLFTAYAALSVSISHAQSIDLNCYNRIGGAWNFGTAPSACNVSSSANTVSVRSQFSPVIFSDAHANSQGRKTYLSSMFPFLREVGTYYIKRRNPSVSDQEVRGFLAGLFAVAEQETLWSHYRQGTDGILRYMRGDNLHGHGLLQVDDRSHVAALKHGKGVDLAYNIIYGLDIYYAAWTKSASTRCVSSPSNFSQRARAAWAAYNGGPGAICRWTANGSSDQSYNSRYVKQAWLGFVADPSAATPLNVKCLVEGKRPCS